MCSSPFFTHESIFLLTNCSYNVLDPVNIPERTGEKLTNYVFLSLNFLQRCKTNLINSDLFVFYNKGNKLYFTVYVGVAEDRGERDGDHGVFIKWTTKGYLCIIDFKITVTFCIHSQTCVMNTEYTRV